MSISSSGASVDGMSAEQLSQATADALGQGKQRKIRTKYDIELAQMDADDTNNWEIHSSNRQRALYHRLYLERDKKGYTKDPMAIYEAKLNALSPVPGDFRAYMRMLLEERGAKLGSRMTTPGVSVDITAINVCTVQLGEIEAHSHLFSLNASSHAAPALILKPPEPYFRAPPTPIGLSLSAAENNPECKSVLVRSYSQKQLSPSASSNSKITQAHHRLTPAQLEAIQERQAILDLDAAFDKTIMTVDRISKIATKKLRRHKAEYRRMARSMSKMALVHPLPPLLSTTMAPNHGHGSDQKQHSSDPQSRQNSREQQQQQHFIGATNHPMTALLSSLLEVPAAASPHPAASPVLPNTRHMAATILLDRQTSIDGVMEMTRKQKAAELNWVRKVRSMLTRPDDAESSLAQRKHQKKRRGNNEAETSVTERLSISESMTSSLRSLQKTKRQQLDKKISERQSFGPYFTKELLALLKAFQSLPEVYVPSQPRDDPIAISHVLHEEHQQQRALHNDAEWSEDEEEEKGADKPTEVAHFNEERLDSAEIAEQEAQLLLLKQRQQEEALERLAWVEKCRLEDEEEERAAKYNEQVLSTSIKLLPLRNHPFMKLRPAMKSALDTYIAQRCEDGTLPHNVICALSDLLNAACTMMKPDDRQQCLRLFIINTPSQDISEAASRGVTVAQLKKLRDMFKFFDKDGSGGIDKEEILEVLLKLQENSGNGNNQEIGEDLIKDVMGNSGEELSFDDFTRSFKSLVQTKETALM